MSVSQTEWDKRNKAEEKRLEDSLKESIKDISGAISNKAGYDRLEELSQADWDQAQADDETAKGRRKRRAKGRDWQSVVSGMTNVQKMVHLAMRQDSVDEERIRTELVKVRRRAYEDELTNQAARVGCKKKTGRLGNNDQLTALNDASKEDAASITNTFNFDLAAAIINISTENPKANRQTYAKRLKEWEDKRAEWKAGQIAMFTEGSARSLAQQEFADRNDVEGYAELEPQTAAEEICQGWINRGQVPMKEAMKNPPPYHGNCPHRFRTYPEQASKEACDDLWMGE